jgi:hypothetical protein
MVEKVSIRRRKFEEKVKRPLSRKDPKVVAKIIEANKDKLNLKPNLEFVVKNKRKYVSALLRILEQEPSKKGLEFVKRVEFRGTEDIVGEQISPEEAKALLARMPESLIDLSQLESVSYHLFDRFKRVIPVPGYDPEGNFDSSKVKLVDVDEFPGDYHPTRILVGVSNGKSIFPTPIPETVSKDKAALRLYQTHVFLHEFFHTIDYPRRNPEERRKVVLEVDGKRFTLENWWKEFQALVLSNLELESVSSYANTYRNVLTKEMAKADPKKFESVLGEQICETFVAYMLDIISNNSGWISFRNHSFGNRLLRSKFDDGKAPAANMKWILMDRLCRAKVISK